MKFFNTVYNRLYPKFIVQPFKLKIGTHLETSEKKRHYNEQVFTEVSKRYDFITRVLSFGQDASWKKILVSSLPNTRDSSCLDIACGTGDLTFLLAEKYPQGFVTGIDIAQSMLDLAYTHNIHHNVSFMKGDMSRLDVPNKSVDIITGGYALRNAPDLNITIDEIHRVLKVNGIAAFLDFSKPPQVFIQKPEYYLLKFWTGLWGLLLHRNHEVYSYIAESLKLFPDRKKLKHLFENKGFKIISSRLNFFGITEIILIQKISEFNQKLPLSKK